MTVAAAACATKPDEKRWDEQAYAMCWVKVRLWVWGIGWIWSGHGEFRWHAELIGSEQEEKKRENTDGSALYQQEWLPGAASSNLASTRKQLHVNMQGGIENRDSSPSVAST